MLPQAHPSSINEPMTSTHPTGGGWEGRQVARSSSHQKMSPDLGTGSQKDPALTQSPPHAEAANMPHGTSPQALNALVSALVPFKPQTSPKQQEHVLHNAYVRITSMNWSPRQIDHPEICSL